MSYIVNPTTGKLDYYEPPNESAGSGDMVLASSQTNSGVKTFLNGTFKLRNVANTFSVGFSSAATANRTVTVPDADFTVARTDAGQTFTGDQDIANIVVTGTALYSSTVSTAITSGGAISIAASGALSLSGVAAATLQTENFGIYVGESSGEVTVTGLLVTSKIRLSQVDLSTSTTPSANVSYYGARTAGAESWTLPASPTAGDRVLVKLDVSGGVFTITWSGSVYRVGGSGSSTTLRLAVGTHEIVLAYSGGKWWQSDTGNDALTANTFFGGPTNGSADTGGFRTLVAADLPSTLTSGTAITNAALTTPTLGTPASGNLTNCTADGTNLLGYRGAPQNSQTAAYTTVLADAGKCIFHPSSDNNARTFTIDSNANVAFPIGTIIKFKNMAATAATIAITSDTMTLLPAGTTGSRTLAQYGEAYAEKISSTAWTISGNSALT